MKKYSSILAVCLIMVMCLIVPAEVFADEGGQTGGTGTDTGSDKGSVESLIDKLKDKTGSSDSILDKLHSTADTSGQDVKKTVDDWIYSEEQRINKESSEYVPVTVSETIETDGKIHTGSLGHITAAYIYTIKLTRAGCLSMDIVNKTDLIGCSLFEGDYLMGETYEIAKTQETLSWDLAPGEYKLYVLRGREEYIGDFTVSASFDPANETYEGANDSVNDVRSSKAVRYGDAVRGQLAYNDDTDFFKLTLAKAGRLSIDITSTIGKVYVELYDSNKDRIGERRVVEHGDDTVMYDLVAGDYFLRFERKPETSSPNTGIYIFEPDFTSAKETYSGNNNSINAVRNAKAVKPCKLIRGQLAVNDIRDYTKIYVPAAGKYALRVKSDINEADIRIYDKKDVRRYSYYHQWGTKTYNVTLKKGTYYILVENTDIGIKSEPGETGTYSFKFTPAKVGLRKVTSGKKSFTAKWAKGTGTGYELQFATGRKFSNGAVTIRISGKNITSKKVTGLRKGKTYYVRVRSYVKSGSTFYRSAWSTVKKVKISA